MLPTWHFYGKMNSDIFSFYAALRKLERPMQLVLCKCCCWQCWDLGVVCGLGGEAGEGVSALYLIYLSFHLLAVKASLENS